MAARQGQGVLVTQPEPAPGGPPSLAEAAPTRIRHAVEQEWRESVRLLALAPRLRRQVPGRSSDGDRKDEFGWIGRSVFGPLELVGRVASALDVSDLVVGRAKVQGVADCAALPMADAIRDAKGQPVVGVVGSPHRGGRVRLPAAGAAPLVGEGSRAPGVRHRPPRCPDLAGRLYHHRPDQQHRSQADQPTGQPTNLNDALSALRKIDGTNRREPPTAVT